MFDLARTTLTEYLIAQRRAHPGATGEFNALILQVAQACKAISRIVAHGALGGALGSLDSENVQSETQKKLDVIADEIFLRRMHDYVHYICPQFARTHVNFQRVPMVDTSNPFIARAVPTADESMVVIRFAKPAGIDFPYLLNMIHDSFMSRANTIVVPGGKMELAMQLIFTPFIWRLVERRNKAMHK